MTEQAICDRCKKEFSANEDQVYLYRIKRKDLI